MKNAVAFALAAASLAAVAAPITPTYDTFGNLAAATWGGSGIPTNPAAITVLGAPTAPQVTLGLIGHQRFSNPALTNDGAGTYFAQPGVDTNPPSPGNPYATWNFGFYIGGATANYSYTLFYDFDPATGTDQAAHGQVDGAVLAFAGFQNSWNLGMDFLDSTVPTLLTEPLFPSFDPNAVGQYTFALVAYDQAGAEAGRAAIAVNVGALQVPEPGALALASLSLLALAASRRRRRRRPS